MPVTAVSDPIPFLKPATGHIRIVRDDREGLIQLMLNVGNIPPVSVSLDAAGWRALSHALGVPPASDFVPAVRHCSRCFKSGPNTRWVAANLCYDCLGKALVPTTPKHAHGGAA